MFYKWLGKDGNGVLCSALESADSVQNLSLRLREKGISVISINAEGNYLYRKYQDFISGLGVGAKAKSAVIYALTIDLARLSKTPLPLEEILNILSEQHKDDRIKKMLHCLAKDVAAGDYLSCAMSKHPFFFSSLYIKVMELGERHANLSEQFVRLADHYKIKLEAKSKIVKALSYPLTVCCLAVVLLLGLLYFVVPRLGELLASASSSDSLPWIVRASRFLHGHLFAVLVLPLLMLAIFYVLSQINKQFRHDIVSLLVRLPVVSRLFLLYQNSQWLYHLGVSLQCGSTLAECLCPQNSSLTTGKDIDKKMSAHARRLCLVQQGVASGCTLHNSIAKAGLFSPRDLSLIAIAEKTTALDTMLLQLSQLLQLEFEELIARYLSFLQPVMLLFLSVVVASMVAAIYLPLLQQGGRL